MRIRPQQLPHIYRFLTAGVAAALQKYASLSSNKKQFVISSLPFMVIILYLFFSLFSPASDFDKARMRVLKNPKDAHAHLVLSRIFKSAYDLEKALQEIQIASYLSSQDEVIKAEIASLYALKDKPNQLQKELDYWQKISWQKSNYRDAFVQKAILEYQLKDTAGAKADLQKALELDPNYEYALKMQKNLGK